MFDSGETPLQKSDIRAVLRALAHHGTQVPIYFTLRPNLRDEGDNMVYECAVNFGADYIVTHNVRDFEGADLKPYRPEILTPRDLLAEIGL